MDPKLVHAIRIAGAVDSGGVIVDAELSDYFGVPCIKGRSLTPTPRHWASGTILHFPLDKISSITVYESEAAWKVGIRKWDQSLLLQPKVASQSDQ